VTVERHRRFGWDFVKLQPRATCFAEAFGSRYRPSGDESRGPVLLRAAIRQPADWNRLPAADASAAPLADQVRAIRLVAEALGPSVPVLQTVFSPLTVAGYLVGEDRTRAASELREHPDLLRRALDRIADALVDFSRASVDAGASGIFYAVSGYAGADLMAAEDYERLAMPHDHRVLESVPGSTWFNVLHLCGPRIHFGVASSVPANAVSWSVHEPGNPSLAEGRDRSFRAAMGGIDQVSTLVTGSRRDVLEQARQAMEETGRTGMVLAPGCSVPTTAPEGNLAAVTEAVAR
jgi:uroporphyrinogen decarboxylase